MGSIQWRIFKRFLRHDQRNNVVSYETSVVRWISSKWPISHEPSVFSLALQTLQFPSISFYVLFLSILLFCSWSSRHPKAIHGINHFEWFISKWSFQDHLTIAQRCSGKRWSLREISQATKKGSPNDSPRIAKEQPKEQPKDSERIAKGVLWKDS